MILSLFKRWWDSVMQRVRAIQEDQKFHGLNLLLGCWPPYPCLCYFPGWLSCLLRPSTEASTGLTQRLAQTGLCWEHCLSPLPKWKPLLRDLRAKSLGKHSHINRSRVSRKDSEAPKALKSFPAALGRANCAMEDLLWEWAKPQSTNTVLLVDLFQPTSM